MLLYLLLIMSEQPMPNPFLFLNSFRKENPVKIQSPNAGATEKGRSVESCSDSSPPPFSRRAVELVHRARGICPAHSHTSLRSALLHAAQKHLPFWFRVVSSHPTTLPPPPKMQKSCLFLV